MTQTDPFAYFEEVDFPDAPNLMIDAFAPRASTEEPDFVLLDNAGGRFVVDPRSGLICIVDELLIEAERDTVHRVQLEAREAFSQSFVMTLWLKIDGLVPSMVDAPEDAIEPERVADAPLLPWRAFAAFLAQNARCPYPDTDARFGAACDFGLEESYALSDATLALSQNPPAPADEAAWG